MCSSDLGVARPGLDGAQGAVVLGDVRDGIGGWHKWNGCRVPCNSVGLHSTVGMSVGCRIFADGNSIGGEEESRVGKECEYRWVSSHHAKNAQ